MLLQIRGEEEVKPLDSQLDCSLLKDVDLNLFETTSFNPFLPLMGERDEIPQFDMVPNLWREMLINVEPFTTRFESLIKYEAG